MRYCPVPSATAVRTFSIRAGLEASTLAPGSTPPDASLTTPVMLACAKARMGRRRTNASSTTALTTRIGPPRMSFTNQIRGLYIHRFKAESSHIFSVLRGVGLGNPGVRSADLQVCEYV